VSLLSRQCRILNISQPYRPPRPVTGRASTNHALSANHNSRNTTLTIHVTQFLKTEPAATQLVKKTPAILKDTKDHYHANKAGQWSQLWAEWIVAIILAPPSRVHLMQQTNIFKTATREEWPPLWSSGQSSWVQIQRSGFDYRHYQIFWEVVGLEWGPLSLVSTIKQLLGRKSNGYGLETANTAVGIRRAD
jgi:hypothetical protein